MRKQFEDLVAVLFFLALIALMVHRRPEVMTAPPPANPPQVVMGKYDPIAIWNERDRELTVTMAMPREALICIRSQCRLAEEWIGK